jgi:hypothetical protein
MNSISSSQRKPPNTRYYAAAFHLSFSQGFIPDNRNSLPFSSETKGKFR